MNRSGALLIRGRDSWLSAELQQGQAAPAPPVHSVERQGGSAKCVGRRTLGRLPFPSDTSALSASWQQQRCRQPCERWRWCANGYQLSCPKLAFDCAAFVEGKPGLEHAVDFIDVDIVEVEDKTRLSADDSRVADRGRQLIDIRVVQEGQVGI